MLYMSGIMKSPIDAINYLSQRTRLKTIVDACIKLKMISFSYRFESETKVSVEHSAPLSF